MLIVSIGTSALAAYSNYNSILIGDQAAGMGGAAVAVEQDASAGAWYNPANLGALKGQSFSASVGIYKKFATSFGASNDVIKEALRANQGFFQAIPSSTGSVVRPDKMEWLKDYTLTLSILVPEYDSFRGDITSTSTNTSTLSLMDQTLWVGAAISRAVSGTEFAGATVYYTSRSMTQTINERSYNSSTDYEIYSEERTIKQNGIVAILGYLKNINDFWKWGVSFRAPSIHVAGSGTYSENKITNGTLITPKELPDLSSKATIPPRLALGFAYNDREKWLWALDITAYGAVQYKDLESDAIAESIEHKAVVNFSLGAEYQWREWFKLRGGVFTNLSSHPDPDPTKVHGQGDRVDQYGFSANAAMKSGNIEYTFGGYFSGGSGKSAQRFNRQIGVIDKNANTFTMLVGTSYFF